MPKVKGRRQSKKKFTHLKIHPSQVGVSTGGKRQIYHPMYHPVAQSTPLSGPSHQAPKLRLQETGAQSTLFEAQVNKNLLASAMQEQALANQLANRLTTSRQIERGSASALASQQPLANQLFMGTAGSYSRGMGGNLADKLAAFSVPDKNGLGLPGRRMQPNMGFQGPSIFAELNPDGTFSRVPAGTAKPATPPKGRGQPANGRVTGQVTPDRVRRVTPDIVGTPDVDVTSHVGDPSLPTVPVTEEKTKTFLEKNWMWLAGLGGVFLLARRK